MRTLLKNGDIGSSIIFNSTFGHKHRAQICVDSGADTNIMGGCKSKEISNAGVFMDTNRLDSSPILEMTEENKNE